MDEKIAPRPAKGEPYEVVILGSGPAGLTAAIYTTRSALSTLIVGGAGWGGQLMLTTEVDNYPGFPKGVLGPDLMQKMRVQAERFGAVFLQQDATAVSFKQGLFKVKAGGKEYKSRSVIIATGAQTQWLGFPSEQKFIGRGVSSCAPCDAPFFRDKKVIVVGGGDSAMEEAQVLTRYARSVTVVHRRDELRASEAMQKKVLGNPKVKVLWNSEVTEVLGDEKVTGVKIKNNKINKVSEMPIDGVFIAIGHIPSTKLFEGQIELDQKGYVKVHDHTKTSVEGVFVAGDVHDWRYKQAVTAAGFGCMAATDAEHWLEEQKSSS